MAYGRPPRGHRIPTAAQTKTYIVYTHLAPLFSFHPCTRSFSLLSYSLPTPLWSLCPPPPPYLLFEPLLRSSSQEKRGFTLSPSLAPSPFLPSLSICLRSSLQYHNDTCHDFATNFSINSVHRVPSSDREISIVISRLFIFIHL